jgi:hypothetical protein
MRNKIEDLRNHLFEQLERLNDEDCNVEQEVEKAKAMAAIGAVIVDSAKAEISFIRATGSLSGTGFIQLDKHK